ncbi:hypothetical protein [Flavobacterium sp.]|uniref:hypothetical protein n=1 Tax=Flavobacterium sp. TaxID=239 RepID=UPI003D6C1C9E
MRNTLFFLCLLVVPVFILTAGFHASDSKKASQTDNGLINFTGIYVSRDTLPSLDKDFKKEITVSLMKFHQNGTVQMSGQYSYNEGEPDQLNNFSVVKWLYNFTSFYFTQKKTKLTVYCSAIRKKKTDDGVATSRVFVDEAFKIKGDTLFRDMKTSKHFKKIYILNKELTGNHMNVKQTNGCE